MENIHFACLSARGDGLTNQLFRLVTASLICIWNQKKLLVVSQFRRHYDSDDTCPVREVIDLESFRKWSKSRYGFDVIVLEEAKFDIRSVDYGGYDIKDEIMALCWHNGTLLIPKNLNLNKIKGDPMCGVPKKLRIKFAVSTTNAAASTATADSYEFIEEIDEYDSYPVSDVCIGQQPLDEQFFWYGPYNEVLYREIIYNIKVADKYIAVAQEAMIPYKDKKINVLHLRLEEDGLQHWGTNNGMTPEVYKMYIEKKYIDLIERYTAKDDFNIVLTYSDQNAVIKFLKENSYNYYMRPKDAALGREINGLYDLALGLHCNNVFIGNFCRPKYRGSTFSQCILHHLQQGVKCVIIDMDGGITREEDVFIKGPDITI